jgi:hypothetical protein
MTRDVFTMAEATGVPVYPNTQNPLPGIDVVRATNDAGVEISGTPEDEEDWVCE